MKKRLILMIFLILFLSHSSAWAFNDIPYQYQFTNAINFLEQKGIIQGYSDGTYRPLQTLKRGELLTVIIKAKYGYIPEVSQKCFKDMDIYAYYAPYTCYAKSLGIIKGYSDGAFRFDQNINFAEAVKIGMATYHGGQGGIRTPEGVSQQIYSLPSLAA